MKLALFIFIAAVLFVLITGTWKIAAPWIIETTTSIRSKPLQQVRFPSPIQSETTELSRCRMEKNKASTPALIECAFIEKKINKEQRILYLTYAVYDYKELPSEYISNTPWEGTGVVEELNDIVTTPSEFCTLSLHVQNEIRKYLPHAIKCP